MTTCTSCTREISGKAPDVFVCAEVRDMEGNPPLNAVLCQECAMKLLPDAYSYRVFPRKMTAKETQK